MKLKKSFQLEIDLEKIIYSFSCIALITNQEGRILLANSTAEKLFLNWEETYLINYIEYDQDKLKRLYQEIQREGSVFEWEMFFSCSGTLVYLEIVAFKVEEYYLLLAAESPTKIDYLNRIATLTGEVNLLNQRLSKKSQNVFSQHNRPRDHLLTPVEEKKCIVNSIDNTAKKITYPEFEICALTRKVTVHEKSVRLTTREFELLWLLASNPNKIFSRNYLLRALWESNYTGDDNTVTVHIRRLRKKIEDDPNKPRYIKTVWGVGYRFELSCHG